MSMGVYIKGMEMPTSCDECRIMVLEDTNCEAELYCGCPIVFKAHPQGVNHRPDYCPLVPVPPHGRLIDADALFDFILNIYKTAQGDARKAYRDVLDTIVAAGDVITAEEGE